MEIQTLSFEDSFQQTQIHVSEQPSEIDAIRVFDFMVALTGLVVLSIPLTIIALLIKIDSPGPVFFWQPRVGYQNKMFKMCKFRSMHANMSDLSGSCLTERDDPRVTRLGKWLRALSIDEIPQLYNVLIGDMAIVGPRPHAINAKAGNRLYSDVVPHYHQRHCVRPGLTGWAQVNGWRGETKFAYQIENRVTYDLEYISRKSLYFNVVIMLRTFREIWRHDAF